MSSPPKSTFHAGPYESASNLPTLDQFVGWYCKNWARANEASERIKEIRAWKLGDDASDDLARWHWQANKVCDLLEQAHLELSTTQPAKGD